MNGTNYEVPHGAFSTPHSHLSWAQIFASGSCFQISFGITFSNLGFYVSTHRDKLIMKNLYTVEIEKEADKQVSINNSNYLPLSWMQQIVKFLQCLPGSVFGYRKAFHWVAML